VDKPTFLDGRYRLDRLVVAHDDVTIWAATDLARGLSVQLSIFERGSTVLHHGKSENGMFVAIDRAARPALEIVDEEVEEKRLLPAPTRERRRAWPWVAAGLASAIALFVGFHALKNRAQPISETTVTAAELPPTITTAAAAHDEARPPPPPPAPPPEKPIAKPAPPERRAMPAPQLPKPRAPKPVVPRAQPSAASYDPLTI
jgi:hypothetical protein